MKRLNPEEMTLGEARRFVRKSIACFADDVESMYLGIDTGLTLDEQEPSDRTFTYNEVREWLKNTGRELLMIALQDMHDQYTWSYNRCAKKKA